MHTKERVNFLWKKFFYPKKLLAGILIVVLLITIPLTVFLIQQVQEIRQRAQVSTPVEQSYSQSISYPWDNPRSLRQIIPVVDSSKKAIFSQLPFSSQTCELKRKGDADCNNKINLADVSYWQIGYERGTAKYGDFNEDGKVTLADYNIWRVNAELPEIPVVQKLSQKLGIEKLLFATFWKFSSPITPVFAQQISAATVTRSLVNTNGDIYSIMNQYADQTYSIETIEPGTSDG